MLRLRPLLATLVASSLTVLGICLADSPDDWIAPGRAAKKRNPIPADEKSIAAGKVVFERECITCHGKGGKGDGPQAKDLEKRPRDLSNPALVEQTDGALFWKITEGRKPMPTFEKLLPEDDRWNVINYVRTLAPAGAEKVSPPEFATADAVRTAVSQALAAYLAIEAALAKDAPEEAVEPAGRLVDAIGKLAAVDPAGLDEKARAPWKAAVDALKAASESEKSAADLASRRAAFKVVSEAMVATVRKFGHAEEKAVRVFTCPKAFDGAGASWLQTAKDAQNPYLGPKMSGCGTSEVSLAAKKP